MSDEEKPEVEKPARAPRSTVDTVVSLFIIVWWIYGTVLLPGWWKLLTVFGLPAMYYAVQHLAEKGGLL